MERLEDSVRGELGRFGPPEGDMVALVRAWPAAVGEENARRAWPARLTREGVLVVHATDSVWAFQLGMLASEILERLAAEAGDAAPASLRFVPGPVPAAPAAPLAERLPVAPEIDS
jgi:predicted nucleic acid-binding Zn ribbon protein